MCKAEPSSYRWHTLTWAAGWTGPGSPDGRAVLRGHEPTLRWPVCRRCARRPELFIVPRGPARRSRVGACGPEARGPRCLPFPGGWGTGPWRLRPCVGPAFADGSLLVGWWGRRGRLLFVGWPHRVSTPDAGRAGCPAPLPGRRGASRAGRSPRCGLPSFG